MDRAVFLDPETTGLGETDEIIEIGAVKLAEGKTETYRQLVNPSKSSLSPRIFKLCRGLTEEELRRSTRFAEIKKEFLEFVAGYPLVCHNAAFEKRMLEKALGEELKNTFLDTLELFVLLKPHLPRHSMEYLIRHYLKEDRSEAHRALEDAQDTARLVRKLFADLSADDAGILENTLQLMRGTGWGWLKYLEKISPTMQHPTGTPPVIGKTVPHCKYTLGDVIELLEDEERWQKYLPGYRVRPQQLKMAEAVADAFQSGRALFIEAPTGSGKTLGYLLPAVIWALREREKVFISTNTKNLQEQILKELPVIAAVLGIENINFTDMKGIFNYACRRKVEEEAKLPGGDLDTRLARCYLLNWAKLSTTGEIEEISYWFRLNNKYFSRLINTVRCRREDCEGQECSFNKECFYHRRVREMQSSHLCTINHSLLLTWPGGYPEIKRLIIDEAHSLEEKAFEAFSRGLSSHDLAHFLQGLVQGSDRGYLNYLRFYGRKVLPAVDIKPALDTVERIRGYSGDISMLLEKLREGKSSSYPLRCEVPRDNDELEEAVISLSSALASLARFLEDKITLISARDTDFENNRLFRQGEEYMKTCRFWAGILEDCFGEEKEDSCCYLECSESSWSFRIAPLDVAGPFYGRVISGCNSLVLTSATLAEKKTYERFARALGFGRLEPEKVVYREPLPHVYDYAQNSVLALPSDSPRYLSANFKGYAAKAVIAMAKMLGGRTMVLFTSLERMEKVMETVRLPLEKEGISVLGGKSSSRRADLAHFKEDKGSVLFASRGFFEGVDIKGPALSCIIIEKLSFAFPDDPLYRARSSYLQEMGLEPFLELDLANAVKTLRQQFGRLIRSETDRGVVLVLDQLGGGKWYCDYIINELPGPRLLSGIALDEVVQKIKEVFLEWGYPI